MAQALTPSNQADETKKTDPDFRPEMPNYLDAALTFNGKHMLGSNTELELMDQPLITVDAALHALASANTPDELITFANQAAALEVYARRAKLGMVAQNRCAELRLRAERKLGQTPDHDAQAARSPEKCSRREHFRPYILRV